MEFYIYILFSKTKNRFYIGFTSDLENRLIRHNHKSKGFTGLVSDWELIYKEHYLTKESAIAREKQIKSWKSRIAIEKLIKGD